MKKYKLLILFLLSFFDVSAQRLFDTLQTDYTKYKGKLLAINEYHNVSANNNLYEHIIKQIAAVCKPGDTINIFVEWPYSYASLLNNYLQGDTQKIRQSRLYIKALKGLPVRIIGADFEYDNGKRGVEYVCFLNNILKELSRNNVSIEKLKEYITNLKQNDRWLKPQHKEELITFYINEQKNYSKGSRVHNAIDELLFVLYADHHISSRAKRDTKTFRRLLEMQKLGFIQFNDRYNILIHGSMHTDPSRHNNLYSYFQNKKSSPFRNNCFSIAQVYIDCISSGDYFKQAKIIGSVSIFGKRKQNEELTAFIKAKYDTVLSPNSITNIATIEGLPLVANLPRIISWYIQWQTQ